MPYGGIDFEQVWRYQIGCMMSNQYQALIEGIYNNSADDIIVACLRLGWNDAFKHVSENDSRYQKLNDKEKENKVIQACKDLVLYFKEYASKVNTQDRYDIMVDWIENENKTLDHIFSGIKNTKSEEYPLCLGHIQKMFNIAIKLLLCLIVSAEHANAIGIKVALGKIGSTDVHLTDHGLLSHKNFKYSFDTADCPIDHNVLEKIDKNKTSNPAEIFNHKQYKNIVWSKMGDKEKGAKEDQGNYLSAQTEIANIQKGTGKSNLCFDFEYWK